MSIDQDHCVLTKHGFDWGPMKIKRLATIEPRKGQEQRVVGVQTPRDEIEVYVSKTGLIRVFRKGKGELSS